MPRRVKNQSTRDQITHDVTVHWLELEKLNKDIEAKAKDQSIKHLEQQNKDLLELVSYQMRVLQGTLLNSLWPYGTNAIFRARHGPRRNAS